MRSILLSVIYFIFFYLLQAQHPNVMITDQDWPDEPSIYMDPDNTDHLLAGANIDQYFYSNFPFKLQKPSIISLKIYDLCGHEIATLIDQAHRDSGKYVEHFDAPGYHISPGMYYFELSSEDKILRHKMVYIK
jgi:hypothetical protein